MRPASWPIILRSDGSFPYGSPDLRRLRAGRYCVLYEISEDAIAIRHIAGASLQMASGHAWPNSGTLPVLRVCVSVGAGSHLPAVHLRGG